MFKLPTCPYCNTIYRYGDVKKSLGKSEVKCYHCEKNFKVSKIKILILFLLIAFITAILNIFQLCLIEGLTFAGLMITNVIAVTIGIFLIPYFITYKKSDK
jgi:CXXC-20-CXXC protein